MHFKKRYIATIIFFLLIIILILFVPCKKQIAFYNNKDKVWSHRGLSINFPENSIESVNAAYKNGYRGVEIDIRYDSHLNVFFLSHDAIFDTKKLTTLDSLFSNINRSLYFWLDLKNLTNGNNARILKRLNYLSQKYNNKNNFIIENRNASALNLLTKNGYYTSFWLKAPAHKNPIRYLYNNITNKINLFLYSFNAVSCDSKYLNKYSLYIYRNCNIQTWKIYTLDKNDIKPLESINSVKIILFDGLKY
jgi:hypothetical protein